MGSPGDNFTRMLSRSVQLVLHYDGAGFSGWQRQPGERTVQGVLETAVARLCGEALTVVGAGRTDAGVHARGQAAGVRVPEKWSASALRRSMNAILPDDVWIAAAFEMRDEFHPRYSAVSRSYSYLVGTDDLASSPFRRKHELVWRKPLDVDRLETAAKAVLGRSCFRAFAVKGTAPERDDHCCTVSHAAWRAREGGLLFEIRADRFLHHMVRFLVGTMLDIGEGRREESVIQELLVQEDNSQVSPPAPAHALFLDRVEYPADLYLSAE
jgi:tRNA pseudouridine38-40 synthase